MDKSTIIDLILTARAAAGTAVNEENFGHTFRELLAAMRDRDPTITAYGARQMINARLDTGDLVMVRGYRRNRAGDRIRPYVYIIPASDTLE